MGVLVGWATYDAAMKGLTDFTPATRAWFEASFAEPTAAQAKGWPAIAAGDHVLIHAPTGSGKTLAAFLWTLDRLLHEAVPSRPDRCRVLYISPMKALAYDVDRNLRAPLAGIRHAATRLGLASLPDLTTFLRTGDTTPEDRRRMMRTPPDILITTPESLYLLLTSSARQVLGSVRWVIVDEVHAVAGTKRGAHLTVTLERLEEVTKVSPQRIGLSATQRPLSTLALFLGGAKETDGGELRLRSVTIVDAPTDRAMELEVVVPVEDMNEPPPPDPLDPSANRSRSIWPAIYPKLVELIQQHRSTIVFANSRRLAERICSEINGLAGSEIARAHHGSVAREQRIQIEEALKRGELAAVVATSSLELGIDMGAVDLVIQVEAPPSVTSGLQRVGRAGHTVGGISRARIFPKYRGDLLNATVMAELMATRAVEETRIPRNPLDVLAQQVVAAAAMDHHTADDLFRIVRRAAPYNELSRALFDATLDMLAGRYPSDLFAELRPRLVWDRVEGVVTARPGARQLAIANAGTIPDRGQYRVTLPDGSRVGELDEEMVYESRPGDVFILGTTAWRISEITADRVEVVPAPAESTARMPFWKGDLLGRPLATGRAIGRFVAEIGAQPPEEARQTLIDRYHLDEWAAQNLVAYLAEEKEATGILPTDRTLVVQTFRDELGDWRMVLLSPLGARVHAPWAMAVTQKLRGRYGADVDVVWSDDGIAFRFPDAADHPDAADLVIEPDELEPLLVDHLADTAIFAARFREAAGRALLLPRRRPGSRTPLWLQRRRAADLLSVAKQFGSFPIVLECYREILQDDFDVPALRGLLADIGARRIRLAEVDLPGPSPIASSLLFAFIAAYLYEGDAPLAERRAAALTLDRRLLAELLGEAELRELLSPEIVAGVELELQRLTPDRRVERSDDLPDLLRHLGPLSLEDIAARSGVQDLEAELDRLVETRRAIQVRVASSERFAAIEDTSRLRDALGVPPPPGVPHVFLEPVADPLGDVVGRFARTHGPFLASQVATSLGLPVSVAETALTVLEAAGRVVRGSFSSGGSEREWVDTEVLKRLKRRSLAALRAEIEPVDQAALGRFLPAWHRLDRPGRGRHTLVEAIRQLQGADLPASALESEILPLRVDDPSADLDRLMMEGEVVWIGRSPLGPTDGRLALYLRRQLPLLHFPSNQAQPDGPQHHLIREFLSQRGASFFAALYEAAGGGDVGTLLDALWDLVWSGEVTNDSLASLRARLAGRTSRPAPARVLASSFPLHAAGRWSLVADMLRPEPDTARTAAWAAQLVDRHGLVSRSVVAAEGLPGGFAALYPVLARMEETARIRRGYFVEGLGGAQFAMPGAVERLRTATSSDPIALAATDPANPYGGALPWPEVESGRLSRSAGAFVVLVDGRLAAYYERRQLRLLDLDAAEYGHLAGAIAGLAGRRRKLVVETIDGAPVGQAPLGAALREWGFTTGLRGLVMRA